MPDKGKISPDAILLKSAVDSKLPCMKIFTLISENSLDIDETSSALNRLSIKIIACQMGLFGCISGKHIPMVESVSEELNKKITSRLENGKLSCKAAWNIADELNIKKADVASACEFLKIKINRCQLKAF